MTALHRQFFLTFMVIGSVMPYLSAYLDERGLSRTQVGWVLAVTGGAVMVTPVLVTLLADTRFSGRALVATLFALSAGGAAWLCFADRFVGLLMAHLAFALAFAPVLPTQDGVLFKENHDRRERGEPELPYHRVRVWGTAGFLVPAVALFFIIDEAGSGAAILAAVVCCALGVLNAATLPARATVPRADNATPKRRTLPTLAAARALRNPRMLGFWVGMALLHLAITAYYGFYPLLLTDTLGVHPRWLGPISNLGVVIELFFMLGFGLLLRRLGLWGLMTLGAALMVLRFGLLGLVPSVAVAVGTQALHGVMVLVIHVAPPVYLDRHASPAYRASMQGLFTMLVIGTTRIAGNLLAGVLSEVSLPLVFTASAGLSLAGGALIAWSLWRERAEVSR